MKGKLKFLIKQSLKKKIDTKWFKIANVVILVCMVGLMNIDKIINYFGGDFKSETSIQVVDNVSGYSLFQQYYEASTKGIEQYDSYKIENSKESIDTLKSSLSAEENKVIVVLNSDKEYYLGAEIISYEPLSTMDTQLLQNILSSVKGTIALNNSNLTEEELNALVSPIVLKTIVTNPDLDEDAASKDSMATVISIVLVLPFFFLITTLTQSIGAEINEEKSTRGMEIIISNVPAKVHFLSKIIASTLFVLFQGLLLVLYAVIAVVISGSVSTVMSGGINAESTSMISGVIQSLKDTGMLDLMIQGIIPMLVLFIFSFFAYAILAGVLASMTTNIEDYQQLQTPLMIILMLGYYVAIMASQFDGAVFITILSFIPMLSFLIAPIVYFLGQISFLSLCISALITVIFTFLMYRYGLRIYKVGILNYSSKKLWRKMFRSLKEK